ncbi:MAG: hypothetical protein V4659_02250, partial [Pseudomonadota bacterium]
MEPPLVDEPPVDDPPVDEPPVDDPPVEVDEPPVEDVDEMLMMMSPKLDEPLLPLALEVPGVPLLVLVEVELP